MMDDNDRRQVIDKLTSSETLILSLVDGLTPAQWNFHEGPNRWSIAENVEHLALFENFITGAIDKALEGPAEPDKKDAASANEPHVLTIAGTRSSSKLIAREVVRPTGKRPDPATWVAEFRAARAQTIAFAANTQAQLRDHFFPHISLGDLDCYQWLILLGQHTFRHALQIDEVKTAPAYPAA
jgi:hypothetical protein